MSSLEFLCNLANCIKVRNTGYYLVAVTELIQGLDTQAQRMIYSRRQERCRINILSSQLEIGNPGLRPLNMSDLRALTKKQEAE